MATVVQTLKYVPVLFVKGLAITHSVDVIDAPLSDGEGSEEEQNSDASIPKSDNKRKRKLEESTSVKSSEEVVKKKKKKKA